jgi:hypothetical protein
MAYKMGVGQLSKEYSFSSKVHNKRNHGKGGSSYRRYFLSLCRREQKLWEATSLAFRHMDLVRGGHEGVSSFL